MVIPCFRGIRVTRSLVVCAMFCRALFVLSSFFFWLLRCLSFFDLQIFITPLVSSTSSSNPPTWLYSFIVWVRVVLVCFTFMFVLLYCIRIFPFTWVSLHSAGVGVVFLADVCASGFNMQFICMHSQHYQVISNRKRKTSSTLHWQIGVFPDPVIMTQFHITP